MVQGLFGIHTAKVLTNMVYFYNCKVFGRRSYDEHQNLLRKQFSKKVDEKGRVHWSMLTMGTRPTEADCST